MEVQVRGRRTLTRRRATFGAVTADTIRAILRAATGAAVDAAEIVVPGHGINNQTWIVRLPDGAGYVVKFRPQVRPAAKAPRNSPHWPRYLQALFGPVPNGGLRSLLQVTELLTAWGSLRVPQIVCVDESCRLAPMTCLVSEWLPGRPFDWDEHRPGEVALCQLGEHVARVHEATATARGFGIFATGGEFAPEAWWSRFGTAYRTLLDELCRVSAVVSQVRPQLERALERGAATGAPHRFALTCHDQAPTHYLDVGDGTISGMVDIEAHLWAPPEYEVAMLELWARDAAAVRLGYERHARWPETLDAVRPAYWLMTWMEWLRFTYTLRHDPNAAVDLERKLAQLCRNLVGP